MARNTLTLLKQMAGSNGLPVIRVIATRAPAPAVQDPHIILFLLKLLLPDVQD